MYVLNELKCNHVLYFTIFTIFIINFLIVANEDHSQNDCLAMVVLSHGINSTFVYAKDNPYPVEVLWSAFTADKCPTLAGKPKLFFVQVIYLL